MSLIHLFFHCRVKMANQDPMVAQENEDLKVHQAQWGSMEHPENQAETYGKNFILVLS